MYSTLYTKIQDTLDSCSKIKSTWAYPTSDFDGEFPAVAYYPDNFENSFANVQEYEKIYRFKLWIVCDVAGDKTTSDIFQTVLADAVDDVLGQFDAEWNDGRINDNRVSKIIDSGTWGLRDSESGLTAVAELNIRIKVFTNT